MQGCREAHRTVAHGIADQGLHLIELRRGGLHIGVAQHHAPDRGGAHVAGQVDAHSLLLDAGKVLAETSPIGRQVVMLIAGAVGGEQRVVDRSRRVALAGNFGGDALVDL